jgi:Ca2+/H+ antiporter
MINLCVPAIIYIVFSIAQIIIDTYNGLYNTAIIKIVIMFMITTLLQILCERGLNIISWIIVFIPFILTTVIVSIILYIFGLKTTTGTLNNSCKNKTNWDDKNIYTDSKGNLVIYDPYYDAKNNPVYYNNPNIIVPNPHLKDEQKNNPLPPSNYSSSPMFQ